MARSLLNPNALFHGLEVPIVGRSSLSTASTGRAFVQKFRPSANRTLTALGLYVASVVGAPRYDVEIIPLANLIPANKIVTSHPPTGTQSNSGFNVTGAPTVHEAIDDFSDDSASFIYTSVQNASVYTTITFAPPAAKRVAYVGISVRARGHSGSNGPIVPTLRYGAGLSAPGSPVYLTGDWVTYSQRWYFRPDVVRPWTLAEYAALAIGFEATHHNGVDVTSLRADVAYADDNVVANGRASSWAPVAGVNSIAMTPALVGGTDYAIVLHPVVADATNYIVLPTLQPRVSAQSEAGSAAMTAGLVTDPFAGDDQTGAFLLDTATTDEGQPYYDLAYYGVYAGVTSWQTFSPTADHTVRTLKLVMCAPGGQPSADLLIELTNAAGTVVHAATTISRTDPRIGNVAAQVTLNLDAPFAILDANTYRLRFTSATILQRPWQFGVAVGVPHAAWRTDGVNQGGVAELWHDGTIGDLQDQDLLGAIGVAPLSLGRPLLTGSPGLATALIEWAPTSESFESALGAWTAAGATAARSTAVASHGVAAAALTKTGGTGQMSLVGPSAPAPRAWPVTAGETYSFRGEFRAAATGRNCSLVASWLNAAGSVISTSTSTVAADSNSAWLARTLSAAAPAGATHVSLACVIDAVVSLRGTK